MSSKKKRKENDALDKIIQTFFDLRAEGFKEMTKSNFEQASMKFAESVIRSRELIHGLLFILSKDIEKFKLVLHMLSWYIMATDSMVQTYLSMSAKMKDERDSLVFLGKAVGLAESLYHLCHVLDKVLNEIPADIENDLTIETTKLAISQWVKTFRMLIELLDANKLSIPEGILKLAREDGLLKYGGE
ncbi:MAG: hypothetical protein ACTSSP_08520 [Candidatus Asgardarchaeia archaeon]|nr:hypothetical protein [Candidatus Odinarchaeota archaeon]